MLPRVIRTISQISRAKPFKPNLEFKRNSGWDYWVYRREPLPQEPWRYRVADGINCFMWWWIFIHVYYQFGHIVGEFDYPEPKKWTDAELGVVDLD